MQRNWDWKSTDSSPIQRLKLVRRFLDLPAISNDLDVLGSLRSEWGRRYSWSRDLWPSLDTVVVPRLPTPREVDRILKPWRPLTLRQKAVDFWMDIASGGDEAIWLRTYYEPGSDEIWEQFLDKEEDENPSFESRLDVRFLNDATCFNFGNDWELVFDLLPEARGYPPRGLRDQHFERARREITHILQSKEPKEFDHGFIQPWESRVTAEIHLMQAYCSCNYIVIADKEAFASNKLRLIFFDCARNIVRHGRIPVEDACMVSAYQMQGRILEQYWTDDRGTYCKLGEKYLPEGEFGNFLYTLNDSGLTEELWRVMGWGRQSDEN